MNPVAGMWYIGRPYEMPFGDCPREKVKTKTRVYLIAFIPEVTLQTVEKILLRMVRNKWILEENYPHTLVLDYPVDNSVRVVVWITQKIKPGKKPFRRKRILRYLGRTYTKIVEEEETTALTKGGA